MFNSFQSRIDNDRRQTHVRSRWAPSFGRAGGRERTVDTNGDKHKGTVSKTEGSPGRVGGELEGAIQKGTITQSASYASKDGHISMRSM